jgi:hypothetical protein
MRSTLVEYFIMCLPVYMFCEIVDVYRILFSAFLRNVYAEFRLFEFRSFIYYL